MRQISLSDYTVPVRNEEGLAKFKEKECECGLDLTDANPVNPKVQAPNILTGECPKCGQVQPMTIPDYLELTYCVKDSMIDILLSRQNQITGTELLVRDKIARRVLDCTNGVFLLEEDEWGKLVMAVNTVRGLGKPDIELVRRILEAPKIEVEEKK